jgi:hypothetical protein
LGPGNWNITLNSQGFFATPADYLLVLNGAYAAAGEPPKPAAFDDRSIPFAIGSLSYSHSINNVVRVWLAIWRIAGGDLGRTPYMKKKAVTELTDGGHDGKPDTTSPDQRLR